MLRRGDRVPHFEATTVEGERVRYADIWQRRNLVLVSVAGLEPRAAAHYGARMRERLSGVPDTICVVTPDEIEGLSAAGALVADRWGEIHFASGASGAAGGPQPDELAEWLAYVRTECPECQGEAW
jgi:hypothetical protein